MGARTAHPVRATLLMLGATASFIAMQTFVKAGREAGMDTEQVMFWRTAPGLPVLWWMLRSRGHSLWPSEPGQILARSALGSIAMATNFAATLVLTLAQFTTLSLMQPVFVAMLAPMVLGESIRRATWLALALALAGALAVVAPGMRDQSVTLQAVVLGLTSALASAFAQMWVRKATASDPSELVVFHFGAFVAVLAGATALARDGLVHELTDATLVLGMAGFGTLGQLLMTRAYSYGEAATVSIVAYAGIVFSVLADVAVFHVVPDVLALFGAGLVVIAGVTLVRGARRRI